ncbi:MAG: LPS assembly protein LptD [Deltaproteobacteria bacterium]
MTPRSAILPVIALAFFLTAPGTDMAWGAETGGGGAAGTAEAPSDMEPWQIQANRLTYYHATDSILGEGGVTLQRGDLTITADRMIYYQRARRAWASGAIVIRMGEDVLRGEEGELDLESSTGTVKGAYLFLHRNNVHIIASQLWKTGPEEYRAEDATISTCPLPKQAWSFHCKDLTLSAGGNAVGWHNSFAVRDIPVLYSPWVAVPLNRYRKTGFLLPHYAVSSRNGTEFIVPFFWAVSDSVDMTFYQHPMSRRGWMEGAELRYILSEETRGTFRFNYLIDTLNDNDYNNDGYVRGDEKRWWLRAKANQALPWDITAKIDLDLVSDLDYLEEFDGGPMGFDETNQIFWKDYQRSLADETDLIRPSTIQATRLFPNTFAGAEGRYNDNLVPGEQDGTVQTLPRFVFHGFRNRIGETPFYLDWDGTYTNYWREKGVRYQRVHAMPRISSPLSVLGVADLLLSGTLEATAYTAQGSSDVIDEDETPTRLLPLFEADLTTSVSRTFARPSGKTLMHSIRPRLTYQYRPSDDQDDIPYIDILDRLEPRNRLTWSFLSFLSSKTPRGDGRYAYTDLLRFYVEQSYDSKKTARSRREYAGYHTYFDFYEELEAKLRYDLNSPDGPDPADIKPTTFSPIYAELELRPWPWAYLRYDTTYSVHGLGFTTYNFLVSAESQAGDRLALDYRYNRLTNINELNADIALRLGERWYGTYKTQWSLEDSTEFRSYYGLRYQASCWALTGSYMSDQDENRFGIYVDLLGVGSWGIQ